MNSTNGANWKKGLRGVGRWVGVGVLLTSVVAPAFASSSPAGRWAKGDWWDVELEQQQKHGISKSAGWIPAFTLHFEVTDRSGKEVRVEVKTIPQNRFKEHLVLRYGLDGRLLGGQVIDPERVTPLGPAGSPGVFGMLGREAFDLLKAPAERAPGGAATASAMTRVPMDAAGVSVQTWKAGEGYWRRFESSAGLPQRATLVRGSWKKMERIGRPER
jgi:hypothetical protein